MEDRYLMTHSLLASWLYAMREDLHEGASGRDPMEEFLLTLRRQPTPRTNAMQWGIDFEDLVTAILHHASAARYSRKDYDTGDLAEEWYPLPEHPWYEAAQAIAHMIGGASLQYRASRPIETSGMMFLLYGRLDALRAGTIYDIKFSGGYERGKFYGSTQHPVYLELIPEAREFVYLVSDGRNVWTERYLREETRSIFPTITDFVAWLSIQDLMGLYKERWRSK